MYKLKNLSSDIISDFLLEDKSSVSIASPLESLDLRLSFNVGFGSETKTSVTY